MNALSMALIRLTVLFQIMRVSNFGEERCITKKLVEKIFCRLGNGVFEYGEYLTMLP